MIKSKKNGINAFNQKFNDKCKEFNDEEDEANEYDDEEEDDDEDEDEDCPQSTQSKGKHLIVTECWVEPQNGQFNQSKESHMSLNYEQISSSVNRLIFFFVIIKI